LRAGVVGKELSLSQKGTFQGLLASMVCKISKFFTRINCQRKVNNERARIRRTLKKPEPDNLSLLMAIPIFLFQLVFTVIALSFYLQDFSVAGITDSDIFLAINNVGLEHFLSVAFGALAVSLVRGVNRLPLTLLVAHAVCLIISVQVIKWTPESLVYGDQSKLLQQTVSTSLIMVTTSLLWIPVNGAWALISRIISLGPTSKSELAQHAPAPAGLARDLRLSRSHARRSRAGR
jgi:hypothetical protein